MLTLKQKISEAARSLSAFLSLKAGRVRAGKTKVSESGNGIGNEDINSKQAKTVERITAPLLEEFYPSHEAQNEGRL